MHLAVVSPFPPAITGVGQYGYHLTRALAHSGLFSRITVLAGAAAGSQSPNHLGLTEVEYCWEPDRWNARQAILARVQQLNPDLVWFNLRVSMFGQSPWLNLFGLSSGMSARRLGYPTVITLHELVELSDLRALNAPGGIFAPLGARLLTSIATQADVVCLTMRDYAEWFQKEKPNVECMHIPHGALHAPTLLDEHDGNEILLFNMLAPFKGVELMLEAFPALRREYPSLQLTIAGEEHPRFPGYVQSVRNRYAGVGGVRWLGRVADEDLQELFRGAQVLVMPYTASTGSSSVLYQAVSWGRAVVASDLGELRALARENNFQIEFFENGDMESLRNAIRGLLDSPSKRAAQVRHNLASVQNSRLEITCHRYGEAFNRALEKRNSPKRIPMGAKIKLA